MVVPISSTRSFSGRGQLDSGQHQQVAGDNRAPDVATKSLPPLPGAAIETEGALEGGDTGLDAGPEVAQRIVHPGTLGHGEHRQPPLLGEGSILYAVLLGIGEVVLGSKAAVGRYLPGYAAIQLLLALKHRLVLLAVGGIASDNPAVKDHGGSAAGEKDLMPVLGLPPLFDDNVGMVFEEGDHFLRGRNLLSLEDPPVSLADHLLQQADCPGKLLGQDLAGEEVVQALALMIVELRNSIKSFKPKDGPPPSAGGGRNDAVDFIQGSEAYQRYPWFHY